MRSSLFHRCRPPMRFEQEEGIGQAPLILWAIPLIRRLNSSQNEYYWSAHGEMFVRIQQLMDFISHVQFLIEELLPGGLLHDIL